MGSLRRPKKGAPRDHPCHRYCQILILNELDQELERRGLKYCRWADDFVIMVRSEQQRTESWPEGYVIWKESWDW